MDTTCTITLTQGRETIIDADDLDRVSQFKWCFGKRGKSSLCDGYALRSFTKKGKTGTIMMHRFVLNAPAGLEVDHINGDGLDNRKSNLRLATSQQNKANTTARRNGTSGRKGVTWSHGGRRWMARITVNGRMVYLGLFTDIEAAAQAYENAARALFGDFARHQLKPTCPGSRAKN